jgi:hypothetical protein
MFIQEEEDQVTVVPALQQFVIDNQQSLDPTLDSVKLTSI